MSLDTMSNKKRYTITRIVQKRNNPIAAQFRALWGTIPVLLVLNAITANAWNLFYKNDHPDKTQNGDYRCKIPFTEHEVQTNYKYGSDVHERFLGGIWEETYNPRRRTGSMLMTHRIMQGLKYIGEEKIKPKGCVWHKIWYVLVHWPISFICWFWDKTACLHMFETIVGFFFAKKPLFYNEQTKTTFELDYKKVINDSGNTNDYVIKAIKNTKIASGWNTGRSFLVGMIYIGLYIALFFSGNELNAAFAKVGGILEDATVRFFLTACITNVALMILDPLFTLCVDWGFFKISGGAWSETQWRPYRFVHPDETALFDKDEDGNYKYVKEKKQWFGRWSPEKLERCSNKFKESSGEQETRGQSRDPFGRRSRSITCATGRRPNLLNSAPRVHPASPPPRESDSASHSSHPPLYHQLFDSDTASTSTSTCTSTYYSSPLWLQQMTGQSLDEEASHRGKVVDSTEATKSSADSARLVPGGSRESGEDPQGAQTPMEAEKGRPHA